MHIGNPRLTRFVYCSDCSDIFKTLSISREKIPKFLQYVDFQEGDLLWPVSFSRDFSSFLIHNCLFLQYLTRGESIFRKEWSIDDHFIREMLSLKNHPVHIPYLLKLFAAGSQVQMDISSLSDEGSMAFEDYWKLLSEHAPQVIHFLKAFRSKSETACRKPSQPSIISTATHSSGFGSIPSSELM